MTEHRDLAEEDDFAARDEIRKPIKRILVSRRSSADDCRGSPARILAALASGAAHAFLASSAAGR
ncbi:hypothetical protein [Candidatus Accumulibacter sp. ACC003]|jgi:hypothetical protein|uniref:hypothetical protein n=1 Tax=Candidatus Accumulibacter sp. ACC003 TaxID=2823334 RepID=UPI0025C4922E|nr:hypothetical protein [Candidatus Accumulibacter sp. ACC003]